MKIGKTSEKTAGGMGKRDSGCGEIPVFIKGL